MTRRTLLKTFLGGALVLAAKPLSFLQPEKPLPAPMPVQTEVEDRKAVLVHAPAGGWMFNEKTGTLIINDYVTVEHMTFEGVRKIVMGRDSQLQDCRIYVADGCRGPLVESAGQGSEITRNHFMFTYVEA